MADLGQKRIEYKYLVQLQYTCMHTFTHMQLQLGTCIVCSVSIRV